MFFVLKLVGGGSLVVATNHIVAIKNNGTDPSVCVLLTVDGQAYTIDMPASEVAQEWHQAVAAQGL